MRHLRERREHRKKVIHVLFKSKRITFVEWVVNCICCEGCIHIHAGYNTYVHIDRVQFNARVKFTFSGFNNPSFSRVNPCYPGSKRHWARVLKWETFVWRKINQIIFIVLHWIRCYPTVTYSCSEYQQCVNLGVIILKLWSRFESFTWNRPLIIHSGRVICFLYVNIISTSLLRVHSRLVAPNTFTKKPASSHFN